MFLGGRIGYVLFYNLPLFRKTRSICSKSGMAACHSTVGLIGVIVVMLVFARRTKRNFFQVADFIAPLIPFGLGAGRSRQLH